MSDIKLYQGDCLEVMKQIPDKSVDCVITDPPYSTPTISSFGRELVKKVSDLSIQETYMKFLCEMLEKKLKDNGRVFIFCDDKYYPSIYRAFYEWQNIQMIIWNKNKIGMGNPIRKQHELIVYANRCAFDYNRTDNITHYPSILSFDSVKNKIHPAQKPVELIEHILKGFTNCGDTVLDMFMGSGTTGVACKHLNRNFIGIELDEEYFRIAENRINGELL